MTRRAWDEVIADYAEASRGEFHIGELRRFNRTIDTTRYSPKGRCFELGDVVLVLEEDTGIFMDSVRIIYRGGVDTIRRITLTMNTDVLEAEK